MEAVIPGAQGRLLAVLAGTTSALNLRTLAGLAEVSPAQASRLLPGLVELGLVERVDVPPAALFRLVDGNLGAQLVRQLADLRRAALGRLGQLVAEMEPSPACAVVFGSMATGEAEASSDIDVLLVRPGDVEEDDDSWHDAVEGFRTAARELTGNPVSVLEVSQEQLTARLDGGEPLWRDIADHGVVIHGPPLPTAAAVSRG
jgi:hypothetical protein